MRSASSLLQRFQGCFLGLLCLFALASEPSFARGDRNGTPGDFDYYALALSWSPSFCESRQDNDNGYDNGYGGRRHGGGDEQQCSSGRPYAFVLHGLWPQYQKDWPESCRLRERPWVSEDIITKMLDIMPSKQLIIHEYLKHGTCSGLAPEDFFKTARRAYESITIPERFRELKEPLTVSVDEVVQAFVKANPQLQPDMLSVTCSRNRLQEVRVCLSKDLRPQSCGQNETRNHQCEGRSLTMPPVRGGSQGGYGRDRI